MQEAVHGSAGAFATVEVGQGAEPAHHQWTISSATARLRSIVPSSAVRAIGASAMMRFALGQYQRDRGGPAAVPSANGIGAGGIRL